MKNSQRQATFAGASARLASGVEHHTALASMQRRRARSNWWLKGVVLERRKKELLARRSQK